MRSIDDRFPPNSPPSSGRLTNPAVFGTCPKAWIVVLFAIVASVVSLFVVWRRRSNAMARTVGGAILIAAGILLWAFDVEIRGQSVVSRTVAALVAGTGALAVAQGLQGRLRHWPAFFFLLAAVAQTSAHLSFWPLRAVWFAGAAMSLACLLLPWIAFAAAPRHRGWNALALAILVACVGLYGLPAGSSLLLEFEARFVLDVSSSVLISSGSLIGSMVWRPFLGLCLAPGSLILLAFTRRSSPTQSRLWR